MADRARISVIDRTWEIVNNQLLNHYRELKNKQALAESEKVA
jgi:hypothetical protein